MQTKLQIFPFFWALGINYQQWKNRLPVLCWDVGSGRGQCTQSVSWTSPERNINFCDKISWCAWDIKIYESMCSNSKYSISFLNFTWKKYQFLCQTCLVCVSFVRYKIYVSTHYLIRFSSFHFQICNFREFQENWKFIFGVAKLISERHKFYKCL